MKTCQPGSKIYAIYEGRKNEREGVRTREACQREVVGSISCFIIGCAL